jgi:hypothetical protein
LVHSLTWVVTMAHEHTDLASAARANTACVSTADEAGFAADVEAAPLADLEAEICGWAGRIAAATCRMLQVLAAFDRREGWSGLGMATCAQWLAWRCGLSVRTAQEQLAVAHALDRLPEVRSAFAAGRLSYSKVRAVARVADAETEPAWLRHALHCTASQLERLASKYHQLTADPAEQRRARKVEWRTSSDGLFRLSAVLTADEGARLAAAIDAARASLDAVCPAPPDGAPDEAPVDGQIVAAPRDRRADADALVTLAEGFLHRPAPGLTDPAHTLTVHVDVDTLLAAARAVPSPGADAGPGPTGADVPGAAEARDRSGHPSGSTVQGGKEIADAVGVAIGTDPVSRLARGLLRCDVGGRIGLPRAVLSRLGCDALVRALSRDEEGSPLDLGRRRRVPTQRLREAVYARDHGTCQYPGCAHTRWLQIHHLLAWVADEGATDLANLALLCGRHHRLIHDEGISLRRRKDGVIIAVLPDGFELIPAPRLAAGARPADRLAAWAADVAADAIHTHGGGRLSWEDSLHVLMWHRRPASGAAPSPPSGRVA